MTLWTSQGITYQIESQPISSFPIITDSHLLNLKKFIQRHWKTYYKKEQEQLQYYLDTTDNDYVFDDLSSALERWEEETMEFEIMNDDEGLKNYFLNRFDTYQAIEREIKTRELNQ